MILRADIIHSVKTVKQYYRVERRCISWIKFIFEAYEGVAVVSTLDAAAGIIVLSVAIGCETIAQTVMKDLSKDCLIEAMNEKEL